MTTRRRPDRGGAGRRLLHGAAGGLAGGGHEASSAASSAPATAAGVNARRYRASAPCAEPGSLLGRLQPAQRGSQGRRVAGRREQRILAVAQPLTRPVAVRRDTGAAARERVEHLVGDHAPGLLGPAEHAQADVRRQRAGAQLRVRQLADPVHVGQLALRDPRAQVRRELALADEHEAEGLLAQQFGSAQHDVRSVERAPLAVLQHGERLARRRLARRPVRPRLRQRADGRHREPVASEPERLLVVRGVRPRVRQDQVRQPEGDLVHRAHGGGLGPTATHQPPVPGERVEQRDKGIEHQPRAPDGGQRAAERHEEVPRVPHHDCIDVEVTLVLQQEPEVRLRHSGGDASRAPSAGHLSSRSEEEAGPGTRAHPRRSREGP